MQIEAVKVFVDVMTAGSFAAVARQRDVDPSSISRSIAGLEDELGFRLFLRTKRKLAPTEAGSLYFAQVRGLVDEFDRAGQQALDLSAQPKGHLRVTACTSFGQRVLASLLPKFFATCPAVSLELVLADHQVDLVKDQIDLAVRFGVRPDGDVVSTQLAPRRFKVCASPGYIAREGALDDPRDLETRRCLRFPMPGYRARWLFRRDGEEPIAVPVDGDLLISHGVTMTVCAVEGLGPALLPDWLCRKEIDEGALVDLFPDYECTATEFETAAWLIHPSRSYVPMKVRAFIDFLQAEVQGFA